MDQLAAAGIDFDDVTDYLERDGLAKFEKSWSELGATVAAELRQQRTTPGKSPAQDAATHRLRLGRARAWTSRSYHHGERRHD